MRLLGFVGTALGAHLLVPSLALGQTLGSADSYAIVGGSAVTAAGTGGLIAGDVGVSPGTSITGFDGSAATIVPPFGAHANDGPAVAAQTSVGTLYNALVASGPCVALAAQLDGVTLPPGIYCFTSSADLAATGTLTLDGSGTYIFQVGSSLTANVSSSVVLTNGADACSVFWQVGSAATLNGFNFVGNVVAQAGVTVGSNSVLTGRALTTSSGAVSLAGGNSVGGCSVAPPTPTPLLTPTPTPTRTPVSTPTPTPTPTPSPTPVPSGLPTPTGVPTGMATPTPTGGATPSPSAIPSPTTTRTPIPTTTPIGDPGTSFTQPADSLVMPFDQTTDHATFFVVSNVSGVSSTDAGFVPATSTHWSYWDESCDHLADVYVCLTLNDTVVVSPSEITSINAANEAIGPHVDLTGHRGFVVVTAYATDEFCSDASVLGYLPVTDAIVGSYTFANFRTGSAFGNDAIGLGFGEAGDHVQLPGGDPEAPAAFVNFAIQTFNPDALEDSTVVLLSLKEHGGYGETASIEVGPNTSVTRANVSYDDNLEISTSLPDARIKCATFTSLIPADGTLIPDTVSVLSSGVLRLDGFTPEIGGDTGRFIFGIHGQAVGNFGGSSNMKYQPAAILE